MSHDALVAGGSSFSGLEPVTKHKEKHKEKHKHKHKKRPHTDDPTNDDGSKPIKKHKSRHHERREEADDSRSIRKSKHEKHKSRHRDQETTDFETLPLSVEDTGGSAATITNGIKTQGELNDPLKNSTNADSSQPLEKRKRHKNHKRKHRDGAADGDSVQVLPEAIKSTDLPKKAHGIHARDNLKDHNMVDEVDPSKLHKRRKKDRKREDKHRDEVKVSETTHPAQIVDKSMNVSEIDHSPHLYDDEVTAINQGNLENTPQRTTDEAFTIENASSINPLSEERKKHKKHKTKHRKHSEQDVLVEDPSTPSRSTPLQTNNFTVLPQAPSSPNVAISTDKLIDSEASKAPKKHKKVRNSEVVQTKESQNLVQPENEPSESSKKRKRHRNTKSDHKVKSLDQNCKDSPIDVDKFESSKDKGKSQANPIDVESFKNSKKHKSKRTQMHDYDTVNPQSIKSNGRSKDMPIEVDSSEHRESRAGHFKNPINVDIPQVFEELVNVPGVDDVEASPSEELATVKNHEHPGPGQQHISSKSTSVKANAKTSLAKNLSRSPFVEMTSLFYLPVPPITQNYTLKGVCAQHLSKLVLTYSHHLNGIVLCYKNPCLLDRPPTREFPRASSTPYALAKAVDEYAAPFVWVAANFVLLRPGRGTELEGIVKAQSQTHLSLAVMNVFSASVEKKRLPSGWTWSGEDDGILHHRKKLKVKNRKSKERGEVQDVDGEILPGPADASPTTFQDGYWMDAEGMKIAGTVSFRIKDFEATAANGIEGSFITFEGTMLDDEAERQLLAQEVRSANRKDDRKRKAKQRQELSIDI